MQIIIHAPNVHIGGGKALLLGLLGAVSNEDITVFIDERLGRPEFLTTSVRIRSVKPNILDRFKAELELSRMTAKGDFVLCFGNLPPLIPNKGNVSVYLQNRYLLWRRRTYGLKLKQMLRIEIERLWLRWCLRNSELIVQTPSMAREVASALGTSRVRVIPFVERDNVKTRYKDNSLCTFGDFIYVASGEPHKNHRNLVEAWTVLAREGVFPRLYLTLDSEYDQSLVQWIEMKKVEERLNIQIAGVLSKEGLADLYGKCGALIYPSLFESLGLPLIEAAQHGLPIIAAELDYVRDVCDPLHTFDPNSSTSIARAVKRYLGWGGDKISIYSPVAFMHEVLRDR